MAAARLRVGAASVLEGLSLGMLPALVLSRLLPHAYESLGFWALVLAAVGFGLVTLSHHAGERAEAQLGGALVLPALLLHAVTDGAALAMSVTGRIGDSAGLLALAAILHRIPEGFFVAAQRRAGAPLALGTNQGHRDALLAAAPLALATIVGAVLGQRMFDRLPDTALDSVLALGAGAMLRLVSHSHGPAPAPQPAGAARTAGVIALLTGIAIVVAVPGADNIFQRAQPSEPSMAGSLAALFVESAPAVLLAAAAMALLRGRRRRAWKSPEKGAGAALSLLGWVRATAAQLSRSELQREAAQWRDACAPAAFVAGSYVAAAHTGIETAALSLVWLGPEVTSVRVLGSAAIALGLGALCSQLPSRPRGSAAALSLADRGSSGVWDQLQRTIDENAAWLLLGLLLSAALEAMITPHVLQRLPLTWATALACLLGLLGGTNAFGATPVVAVLVHKGLSLGGALAFLWLSPLASIWLAAEAQNVSHVPAALQRSAHEAQQDSLPGSAGRTAWLSLSGFAAAVWLGRQRAGRALLAGCAVAITSLLAILAGRRLSRDVVPELHTLVTHEHSGWEYACALVLATLLLHSLLRRGPRGFFAQLALYARPSVSHQGGHHGHSHSSHSASSAAEARLAAATARK